MTLPDADNLVGWRIRPRGWRVLLGGRIARWTWPGAYGPKYGDRR